LVLVADGDCNGGGGDVTNKFDSFNSVVVVCKPISIVGEDGGVWEADVVVINILVACVCETAVWLFGDGVCEPAVWVITVVIGEVVVVIFSSFSSIFDDVVCEPIEFISFFSTFFSISTILSTILSTIFSSC
jgi:hypothetical protein